jgi:hypothetical protein
MESKKEYQVMEQRLKAVAPLAISVAILTFAWLEISLNFTFHWNTAGDLGNGLSLPSSFHLVAPAAFVSWAMFFAAGADRSAANKVLLASVVGAVGGLLLMWIAPTIADTPHFWGIAVVAAGAAFLAVLGALVGDVYYPPAVFSGMACVFFWWVATGLDGWVEGGGGAANTLKSLGDPRTAGSGAFGGTLSTPAEWVFVSMLASLACGVLLGLISVQLAHVFSPKSASAAADPSHVR